MLIDLEKLRFASLKFRTELRDRVMDGWSVTQLMNVCTKNLQIENRSSSRPVNAGRYIAFKHHTSFTIVAQGWGDISNSIQNPSDVTVTFSGQH